MTMTVATDRTLSEEWTYPIQTTDTERWRWLLLQTGHWGRDLPISNSDTERWRWPLLQTGHWGRDLPYSNYRHWKMTMTVATDATDRTLSEGGTYPIQTQTLKDEDDCRYRQDTEGGTYPIQTTDTERWWLHRPEAEDGLTVLPYWYYIKAINNNLIDTTETHEERSSALQNTAWRPTATTKQTKKRRCVDEVHVNLRFICPAILVSLKWATRIQHVAFC